MKAANDGCPYDPAKDREFIARLNEFLDLIDEHGPKSIEVRRYVKRSAYADTFETLARATARLRETEPLEPLEGDNWTKLNRILKEGEEKCNELSLDEYLESLNEGWKDEE